jgi:enoyl-CoA hydratase
MTGDDRVRAAEGDVHADTGPHGSLRIRLAAPERRNSLRPATVATLTALLAEHPARTVVLESSTPGIFCAGADLKIDDAQRRLVSDGLYELYELMVTRPGPVVAVVDGPAVGGGAQLATAADLRVLTPRSRFRWAGTGHGLAVGAWLLPELVGRTAALELTLTSCWVAAEEAVRLGLATSLVADPDAAVTDLLAALAAADAGALAAVKRIATSGGLLDRLREERRRNAEAWDGRAPS